MAVGMHLDIHFSHPSTYCRQTRALLWKLIHGSLHPRRTDMQSGHPSTHVGQCLYMTGCYPCAPR
ncbi:hypothetical protein E4T43_06276 [Aureobasidium subglaciale]|nr:hypothetical protein E4T43_06276 [Aureobasidium subglaciale]